jgi:hypothetical protein
MGRGRLVSDFTEHVDSEHPERGVYPRVFTLRFEYCPYCGVQL